MNKEISKLVSRAKEHDADAFMQLVQPYTKKMYQTALSILVNDEDAADAIQETILNCWEKIQTLKESQYFYTWMTRILINNCYDICKKRTRYVEMQDYEEPAVYRHDRSASRCIPVRGCHLFVYVCGRSLFPCMPAQLTCRLSGHKD